MSNNIVISEVPTRTYTVPSALTASVGERADLDAVYSHLRSDDADTRAWASKIAEGIERDRTRKETAVLASIGYDPEQYLYWGLTASADEDMIVAVGRVNRDDIRIEKSELLTERAIWSPVSTSVSTDLTQKGVAMDAPLLAYAVSAFAEGHRGVMLAYGDPHCFLEDTPMLATAITAAVGPADESEGLIYAIVDATDTTAVMDLIMIKQGPQVYRRDGGAWVLDNSTLDALLSVSPPPIVELNGDVANNVISQVDGNQSNQLAPTEDGEADAGEMLEKEPIKVNPEKAVNQNTSADTSKEALPQKKPSETPSKDTYASNQNKSQLKDGSTAQTAALLQRYDELEAVVAAARSLSSVDETEVSHSKAIIALQAQNLRQTLQLREAQINNIVLPALVADAVSVHDATPNQLKARHLRKYWIRGKGAVKIAWGTPGDFTRCVRQLRKYLGVRAEGYCQLRHKEATGFYTGDKRNK